MRSRGWTFLMVSVVTLTMLPQLAHAGTRGNPEVTDPRGDVVDPKTGQSLTGSDVANVDLLAIWFQEVGTSDYSVTVRVADLTEPPDFRTGRTLHRYQVFFETSESKFSLLIFRDRLGGSQAFLDVGDTADLDSPNTADQTASLNFNVGSDEIVVTLPRTWTTRVTAQQPRTFSFPDGTILTAIRAQASDGFGDKEGCAGICERLDWAGTGSSFTFGRKNPPNERVQVRGEPTVQAVDPGVAANIALVAQALEPGELTANLTASLSRPGWRIMTPMVDLVFSKAESVPFIVQVLPDPQAIRGETAVLTVEGGSRPAKVLLVVGAEEAGALRSAVDPLSRSAMAPRNVRLFFADSTQTPGASSATASDQQTPIFPARLVGGAPTGSGSEPVVVNFEEDDMRIPLGVWRSDPLVAPTTINGSARVSLPLSWNSLPQLKLLALVGTRLPIDWNTAQAPEGTSRLASAPSSSDSGAGFFEAAGVIAALSLAPGDRLEVALFLEQSAPGSGSATFVPYQATKPAVVDVLMVETVAEIEKTLFRGLNTAVVSGGIGAALNAPAAAGHLFGSLASQDGVSMTLPSVVLPQSIRLDSGAGALPAQQFSGSFEAGDVGSSHAKAHAVTVDAFAVGVRFAVSGDSVPSLFVNNAYYLELFKVNATGAKTFLKASRTYSTQQTLILSYYDLATYGAGKYEVRVIRAFARSSPAGPPGAAYTLKVAQESAVTLPDAFLGAHFFWDYGKSPPGEYDFRFVANAASGTPTIVTQHYRLTGVGPTIPPTSAFRLDSAIVQPGQAINFTDLSRDADGQIVRRTWDFGDGTTADGTLVAHAYQKPGSYAVTLTVEDDFKAVTASAAQRVSVVAGPVGPPVPSGPGSITNGTDIVAPLPATPTGGTMGHYRAFYGGRVPHLEEYPPSWRESELEGRPGADYLSVADRPVYVFGSVPAVPSEVVWGAGGATLENSARVRLAFGAGSVEQELGTARVVAPPPGQALVAGSPVDLSALGTFVAEQDTMTDGLLSIQKQMQAGGATAIRSLTFLEGTLHSDARTVLRGAPGTTLGITTSTLVSAPPGSWVATNNGSGILALPIDAADGLAFPRIDDNQWFAVYDPNGTTVAGVVVAGDAASVRLSLENNELRLEVERFAVGELVAAEYLVAYEVSDADATRYAGVLELARQDAEEVGVAYLNGARAAGVGWAGSGATIQTEVKTGLGGLWDKLNGVDETWTLTVDAPATSGGRDMRLILPAGFATRGAIELRLDGAAVSASSIGALADDQTLLMTFPIDHFSERTIQLKGLLPGVSALWQYVTIALGMALAVGGGFVGVTTLRSRAALRAFQEEARKETGAGPRSAAVARALGGPEPAATPSPLGPEAEKAYKSALLRKLAAQSHPPGPGPQVQYDQCGRCGEPLRFYGDLAMVMCPKCGKANVNPRRMA